MKEKKIILSIVAHTMGYGDSGAALLKDGIIYGPVEEERFTRLRYESGFPERSIQYLLEISNTKPSEVSEVLFPLRPWKGALRRIMTLIPNFPSALFNTGYSSSATDLLYLSSSLKSIIGICAPIKWMPHHHSHAWYAFATSNFNDALVVTMDGAGDGATGNVLEFVLGKAPRELATFNYPHSIGIFYGAISDYIGFPLPSGPGKVMGLGAYGDPKIFLNQLLKIVKVVNGVPQLDMSFFEYHKNLVSPGIDKPWMSSKFEKLIGFSRRKEGEELRQCDIDLSSALQKVTNIIGLSIVEYWTKLSSSNNLCLSGGVGLNAVLNQEIINHLNLDNNSFFVPPACSDIGNTVGAIYMRALELNLGNVHLAQDSKVYTGPKFSTSEISAALGRYESKISFEELDEEMLFDRVSQAILDNKIVAWMQGSMECGPRALGNRSILANPTNPNVKNLINSRVKHREWFRPFAPSVMKEYFDKYFEGDYFDEFMLTTPKVRENYRQLLPAITHVDGTARVQVVSSKSNPKYYKLINSFGRKSGHPILLNTSFNDSEPIVCSPTDAIETFLKTNIDLLIIDNFLCQKYK